jgi:hypothetical protein
MLPVKRPAAHCGLDVTFPMTFGLPNKNAEDARIGGRKTDSWCIERSMGRKRHT